MIYTLLVAVALATTPDEQALFDALMAPEQSLVEASEAPPLAPQIPWWPIPAAMLGMGMLWAARSKMMARFVDTNDHTMRVHSRIGLGQGSGLAVVEIATPDGTRTLLMGVGNGVAPQLIADLAHPFRDELIDEILDRASTTGGASQ
mgnify:CR=1 FL=1